MARRTKAQINEVAQIEEDALDFSFDENDFGDISAHSLTDEAEDSFDLSFDENFLDEAIDETIIDLDDLAEQIALATEELSVDTEILVEDSNNQNNKVSKPKTSTIEVTSPKTIDAKTAKPITSPAVDDSIAEQLFGQKPARDTSGGTVSAPLIEAKLRPANDDVTVASPRRKLLRKSNARLYWSTTALSALWAAGGAFVASKLMPVGLGSVVDFILTPAGMAVAAGTAIPIFMLWGFAQLSKRSKELHDIANMVSDAALRLSTTENNSELQLQSLGQTVRQEVAAMGEGIERTLSRAVELEALIQGEVNNLERAYAENETRIHTLITELSTEREAILSHADRVQSTLRGTQSQLSSEFGSITSNIASNVQQVAQTLSQTLQLQGEDLIGRLAQVSEGVSDELAEKFNHTAQMIQNRNKELFEEMEERFYTAAEHLDENGKSIINTLHEGSIETEARVEEAAKRMQEATNLVISNFDEKLKGIDDVILNRSSESISKFDTQLSNLDEKSSLLTSHFNRATDAAIQAFEKRLAEVDTSLGERSSSIIHSFIARAQALEENTEKLGSILDAHTNQINDTLKERTIDIANTFTNSREDIINIMGESKATFEEDVNSINLSIADIIKTRTDDFTTQLASGREVIAKMLEGKTDTLKETVDEQMEFLSKHVSDIEGLLVKNLSSFDEHARSHVESIDERTVLLQESIEKSFETANQVLDAQASNIDQRADALRDSLTVNSAALNEVLVDQARVIEDRIDNIREILTQGDLHFGEALTTQVSLVEHAINTNKQLLQETFSEHIANIDSHTNNLNTTLSASKGLLLESMDSRIEDFNETLKTTSEKIGERATLLEENLSRTLSDVSYTLESQTATLTDRSLELKYIVEQNNESIKETFSEQASALDEHTKIMQSTLEQSVGNIKDVIETSSTTISNSFKDNLATVQDTLNEEAGKASSVIFAARDELIGNLSSEAERTAHILSQSSSNVISSFNEEAQKLQNSFNNLGEGLTSSFIDATSQAENVLNTSGQKLIDSLASETSYIDQVITDAGNNLITSLNENSENVSNVLMQVGETFHASFADELARAENVLNEHSYRFSESLGASASHIEQSLADRSLFLSDTIHQFQESLHSQFEGITQNLHEVGNQSSEIIFEQIDHLNTISKNLGHAAQQTGTAFGTLASHLGEQMSIASKEAGDRVSEQNEALMNAFAERSAQTIQAVNSVKDNLIENVSLLLGHSENINTNANHMLSSLQAIDEHFQETAQFIHNNNNQLSNDMLDSNETLLSNIEMLKGIYNSAFEQISFMSQNFEAHANQINQAFNMFESSQHSLDDNIEARHNNLINLSESIAIKTSDITQVIEHLEYVIGQALERTDQNARESAVQLQTDFEKMLKVAVSRFAQATSDIKRSTDEIKSDLDKTTNDITKSLNMLPNQTKEATSTIRNAVSAQVKTLQELASIVEKNSKSLSIAPTAFSDKIQNIATQPIEKPEPQSKVPQETAPSQQEGWVSSLLARASREENQAVATLQPVKIAATTNNRETLSSLSPEIVRGIDNRAISNLWSNFRRSERNIHPQTLYTANGLKMLERIKRKCTTDGDFLRSVNQYIGEFEKLLREMNKNGASKDAIRHYLTSDTGKVYTMLAHVSGRIK